MLCFVEAPLDLLLPCVTVGVHRALRGPEPGPWAGGGGRYLTSGRQPFRRAATPGVGGGKGGYASP